MNIDKNEITYRKTGVNDIESIIRYRLEFLKETDEDYHDEDYHNDKKDELVSNLRDYFRIAIPSNEFICYFAEYDSRILATGSFIVWHKPPAFHNNNGKLGYVLNMYTIPEARRLGICAEIIKIMITEARLMGIKRFSLHAFEAGINVYRNLGFSEPREPELVLKI